MGDLGWVKVWEGKVIELRSITALIGGELRNVHRTVKGPKLLHRPESTK